MIAIILGAGREGNEQLSSLQTTPLLAYPGGRRLSCKNGWPKLDFHVKSS